MGYILDVLFPLELVGWIRLATLCSFSYKRRLIPARMRCNNPIGAPSVAWADLTLLYPRSFMEGSMFKQISIVGAGRIGQALATIGNTEGVEIALLSRGEHTLLPTGPIVVCTRNDDLQGVLQWIPMKDDRFDLRSKWHAANVVGRTVFRICDTRIAVHRCFEGWRPTGRWRERWSRVLVR